MKLGFVFKVEGGVRFSCGCSLVRLGSSLKVFGRSLNAFGSSLFMFGSSPKVLGSPLTGQKANSPFWHEKNVLTFLSMFGRAKPRKFIGNPLCLSSG